MTKKQSNPEPPLENKPEYSVGNVTSSSKYNGKFIGIEKYNTIEEKLLFMAIIYHDYNAAESLLELSSINRKVYSSDFLLKMYNLTLSINDDDSLFSRLMKYYIKPISCLVNNDTIKEDHRPVIEINSFNDFENLSRICRKIYYTTPGFRFKLMKDIACAGNVINREFNLYESVFDGNGFTISDFILENPDAGNLGLFNKAIDSEVKNLQLKDYIVVVNKKNTKVGSIIGRCQNSSIRSIVLDNFRMFIKDKNIPRFVGKLVGYIENINDNCKDDLMNNIYEDNEIIFI
jgi:hypothetical protein